jgi:hypothetical protein
MPVIKPDAGLAVRSFSLRRLSEGASASPAAASVRRLRRPNERAVVGRRRFDVYGVLTSWHLEQKSVLDRSIPEDVLRFIRECIDRLETLDVLLLLQSTPARLWTARHVSDELRSSPEAVQKTLQHLRERGLLAQEGDGFIFKPATPELAESTIRLAACARERRTAVITAIFAQPGEAIRTFAEAFRFKKGGSDG